MLLYLLVDYNFIFSFFSIVEYVLFKIKIICLNMCLNLYVCLILRGFIIVVLGKNIILNINIGIFRKLLKKLFFLIFNFIRV